MLLSHQTVSQTVKADIYDLLGTLRRGSLYPTRVEHLDYLAKQFGNLEKSIDIVGKLSKENFTKLLQLD